MTDYVCEYAWLGGEHVEPSVTVRVDGTRIREVRTGGPAPAGAVHLAGVTLPGLANAHSHAFHRALRARTQLGGGSFWTWRECMYQVAARLDPASYHALARATFAEMALAGVTCVGEFHYLHHRGDGGRYGNPNAMGEALLAAAAEAGVRISLLDTCYLAGGPGRPLTGVQARFGDGDADAWADRVSELARAADVSGGAGPPAAEEAAARRAADREAGPGGPAADRPVPGVAAAPVPGVLVGAAVHSVRAVPPDQAAVVAGWARDRGAPLHVHLSEQPAENEACRAAYGATPTRLLTDAGVLGPAATAVHATHLTDGDRQLLAAAGAGVCMCPTTERDLADGIGPARALHDAGTPISLGSDSHAVIDLWEEARGLELDERLASGVRGRWAPGELLHAATAAGHAALGWTGAGRIAPGAPADLVTVTTLSPRLAGTAPDALVAAVVFAATAADVTDVLAAGRHIVAGGTHRHVDVPADLDRAIRAVLTP
jgi:cytosine/adenosine deaminase-related metal-dependent hydrolase